MTNLSDSELLYLVNEFASCDISLKDINDAIEKRNSYIERMKKIKPGDILYESGCHGFDIEYYEIKVIGNIDIENMTFTGLEHQCSGAISKTYSIKYLTD